MRTNFKRNMTKAVAAAMAAAMLIGMAPAVPFHNVAKAESTSVVDYVTTGKLRNVMYYGDWSIWGGQGNFYPGGIPADQLTHLNFAFLDFDSNGNLIFCDKDAATGAPVGMPGVQWGGANAGILSAMQLLRAENPNLRIGVSLGGWSKSGDFSQVAASDSTRKAFVQNVLKFIKYTNMDFVDLDWEYPGEHQYRDPDLVDNRRDEGTTHASAADKANYIALLQEFRNQLDAQGKELNKTYELTVALPAPKAKLNDGIDIPKLFELVDFANIMTYDMRGAWDETSGHQTGLYTNPNDPLKDAGLSVDDSVQYLLANGAPSDKIVIGSAFYTRGWEKVTGGADASLPGLFGTAEQVNKDGDRSPSRGALNEAPIKDGEGGRCGGVWGYGSIDKLKAAYPGLKEYWDDTAKAPYLYNAETGAFFTYDNQRSIREKANYVKSHNLGGIISWMASQDKQTSTGKRDELTRTIKEALFGSAPLQQYKISNAPIEVDVKVDTYQEAWSNAKGYTITIKNTAKKVESGETLSLVETAGKTIKMPKLYIKTKNNQTFTSGGYGSGQVTNKEGVCIVDLATVYDNMQVNPGGTITFQLKSSADTISIDDIDSIELSQRITASGVEISKQVVY
ncbi:glycosyl hydrolase family 18 protein [Velocimicrobium porci]|uniref:chitinase n=1 Tax=Velocimicrobium porci TaxID=2606634 RepID=A0A6L5Y1U7_9FIRM|nr:glycoside hydrolase family 18 protein [Velocimicrobium porci]MSS64827.1 glycoside hydrolase family 18 protein [Velocimicrobium porci]